MKAAGPRNNNGKPMQLIEFVLPDIDSRQPVCWLKQAGLTIAKASFAYQVAPKQKVMLIALLVLLLGLTAGIAPAQDLALAIYAGQLTKEKWEDAIAPGAEFADATILVVAGSWTFSRFFGDRLSCELEVQVGKYVGDQDHWEFNLPVIGLRWHRFPWSNHLATSLAWGIGPSYATRVPKIELETNASSSHWLLYWFGELTFGPPAAVWDVVVRLHHRSDGFGTVAADGGSNALCAGIRFRF